MAEVVKCATREAYGKALVELGEQNDKVLVLDADLAAATKTGMFKKAFPERFIDVGIAEEHAATFAAGLAAGGSKPIVALYSTFAQRCYDQILHDIALQNLPVVFALDRAGLVGEDGPTHHGVFDLSFLRDIPNLIVAAPADENELQHMLKTAFDSHAPFVLRYPRGFGTVCNP